MGIVLWLSISVFAQSSYPIKTEWRSPDGSKPTSYAEWKARWDAQHKKIGGEVIYRSGVMESSKADSFIFGNDYAYFKGFVRHGNNTECKDLPPVASFIVLLKGNDNKILTDESPRWSFGDPNISGMGWYGIELGNFFEPEVSVGDSFEVIFSCYNKKIGFEQGIHKDEITSLPLLLALPTTLQLNRADIPLPPAGLKLNREASQIEIDWKQQPGLSYSIYRRDLNDTLVLHFPRYQYEKVAEGIIDSCFIDSTIVNGANYGYILFAKKLSTGLSSGRSQEVRETPKYSRVRAILVQPELYPGIKVELSKIISDWEEEGKDIQVVVYDMQYRSCQALRDTLRSIKGLTGALLIGNFPIPWYQTGHCTKDSCTHYQEFPADLYYMDLDGIWQDNYHHEKVNGPMIPGGDGIFDTHKADYPRSTEAPEIVIGRILPTPGMGDPIEITNFYLDKCHRYRHNIGDIRQDFKALAYEDDDWKSWGNDIANDDISLIYNNYLSINDINLTSASDYQTRLDEHYSLIHLWVHSWPQGHSFKIENGAKWEAFYNYQILAAHANANFYNLFACGNSRYIEDKNCAAVYALQTKDGINTIGTTNSGGMLDYDYFYHRLAEGMSFGEAFLKTLQHVGKSGFSKDDEGWYYGLTFNGDPFIAPKPGNVANIVQNTKTSIPERFNLVCYPNPFNSATRIQYRILREGFISLKVYDILGRECATLVNEEKHSGKYEIVLNGNNFASGIYYCKIQEGKASETQKLVLLK